MEISHRILDNDVTIVFLNGRLDAASSLQVKVVLQKLTAKAQPKIVVDLEKVSFIDSSGLASLVSGLRLARENDGNIALSNIQPQARTVFHLTMLDRVFLIHPNYNQAKQSLL